MTVKEIPIFCYWDGKIVSDSNGVSYDSFAKTAIKVKQGIKFQELSNLIYQIMGLDKQRFKLKMMCRYPTIVQHSTVKYTLLPITDDINVDIMLDVVLLHSEFRNVDLYMEIEVGTNQDIHTRREHFSSQTLSNIFEGDEAFLINTMNINNDENDNVTNEDDDDVANENDDNDDNNIEEEIDGGGDNEIRDDNDMGDTLHHEEPGPSLLSIQWNPNEELRKGLIFESKKNLQRAVKLYSIKVHRHHRVVETTKVIWSVKCKMEKECGCNWRLRACKRKKHGNFEVTRYKGPHTCVSPKISRDHPQLDSKLISIEVEGLVKEQPSITVAALKKLIMDKYNYIASYRKVWAAKQMVMQNISGGCNKSYVHLSTVYSGPSLMRSKRGRPKLTRIGNEIDIREVRSKNHCGLCLQVGHDRRKCPSK